MKIGFVLSAVAIACASFAESSYAGTCSIPDATLNQFQGYLTTVINLPDKNGGLFKPNRMWAAIVDRQGRLCTVINSGNDPWPGSRVIAIAKASTANAFSSSAISLSTAILYAPTQPGGFLYGLNNSLPFNPVFNAPGSGLGFVPGGVITFGGGLALYSGGQVIGALGVSGDTACADHAIAYRMRKLAALDTTPGGIGSDNIQYAPVGSTPKGFEHPYCLGPATDIKP